MLEIDLALLITAAILLPFLLYCLRRLLARIRDKILGKIAVSIFFGIGK